MIKVNKQFFYEHLIDIGLVVLFVFGLFYFAVKGEVQSICYWFLYIPFGLILRLLYHRGRPISLIFSIYVFICAGVNPGFFFSFKDKYGNENNPFSGIGNFRFEAREFFISYGFAVLLMLIILLAIILLEKCNTIISSKLVFKSTIENKPTLSFAISDKLIKLIVEIGLPVLAIMVTIQNLIMFKYEIGIAIVPSPILPFHLVGILYYSRLYLVPFMLIVAYYLTKFDKKVYFITILLAVEGALVSGSRLIGFIYLIPILFTDFGRKKSRWLVTAIMTYLCFLFANNARIYVASCIVNEESFLLLQMFWKSILDSLTQVIILIPNHIRGIGDRLFGCHSYVLGRQFHLQTEAWDNVKSFFWKWNGISGFGGGQVRLLFGGMSIPDGLNVGFGLGLIVSLLVSADYQILWIIICGLFVGILLGMCDLLHIIFIKIWPKGDVFWKALTFLIMFRVWGGEIIYIRHFILMNLFFFFCFFVVKKISLMKRNRGN